MSSILSFSSLEKVTKSFSSTSLASMFSTLTTDDEAAVASFFIRKQNITLCPKMKRKK